MIVLTKIDLLTEIERDQILSHLKDQFPSIEIVILSSKTGEGLPEFWNRLHVILQKE
jgi:selenocysteine-specific translation elongation factor